MYLPATHIAIKASLTPYIQRVEEQSDGALKFEVYPGGSMVTGKTTLSGVGGGVVDGGQIVDAYHPRELPHVNVVSDLALLSSDPRVSAGAVNETVLLDCEECTADFLEHNVKPLAVYATSPYKLLCIKPANTLEALEGTRIRTPGAWGPWAHALGATSVNISSAEGYEAMERGQLDCTFGSTGWLDSYSLGDVVTHVVEYPMGVWQGAWLFTVNKDRFDGLSEEHRRILLDNLAAGVRDAEEGYILDDERVKKAALDAGGIEFQEAADEIKQRLEEHRRNEVERVAETAKERGVEDPERIIRIFQENTAKWEKIVAEAGDDWDAYEEALHREIFSKL